MEHFYFLGHTLIFSFKVSTENVIIQIDDNNILIDEKKAKNYIIGRLLSNLDFLTALFYYMDAYNYEKDEYSYYILFQVNKIFIFLSFIIFFLFLVITTLISRTVYY
jgi:hypothetical protein